MYRDLDDLLSRLLTYPAEAFVHKLWNGDTEMSTRSMFQIKGLGDTIVNAKKGISSVRAEAAGLQSDASLFVAAVQGVRQQITQAHDDLQVEAETLGNGSPS